MTATVPNMQTTGPVSAPITEGPVGRRERSWRAVLRRPLAVTCVMYLVLLVVAAVFAPLVSPSAPAALDLDSVLALPSPDHLLGTDALGRDVLSRLIYGGRVSLINAAIAAGTFVLVGVVCGLVAGFRGGWTDRVFSWVVDLVIAMPVLIILLVVLTVFGGDMVVAMIALGALSAPGFARVVRAVTLAVREEQYIAAARVSGLPNAYIASRHVLPRIAGPILVHASLFAGGALVVDAGLAYLGFGAEPNTPTWGGMILEAGNVISRQPWLLVPPGAVLGLATLAFALLGDVIRDAAAERTRRVAPRRPARRSLRATTTMRSRAQAGSPVTRLVEPALLSLRGVSIAIAKPGSKPVAVVEDVDLEIGPAETVGLVGESGCGKSILAAAVLGLLPAGVQVVAGGLDFDGADLGDQRVIRRLRGAEIAMISQDPSASLDPVFTVGQQVDELVRRHHGGTRSAIRTRTLELLSDVSLRDPERVVHRYPHELSGGMAQRIAIAMALAGEPKLLIADEPTTALDVTVQAEILQLLNRLQRERGMAILLITHDWGVIASTCKRAYVMYAGHIVESCDVTALFDQPRHPYTAGLLGSSPHRALPGQRLTAIPGSVPAPGEWPQGCHFAPRCELATPECSSGAVPLLQTGPQRVSRCIHHEQLTSAGNHG